MAIEEDLTSWEIASTKKMVFIALGYVVINSLVGLTIMYYFYTVEVGLPISYMIIAMVLFGVWNMINDPLLGYLTDRPMKWTKKYGLRRPWIVISAFPLLIFYVLIFTPPFGASLLVLFLWFIISTFLFDTFFSIYNDHVYGAYTNQFPSEYERRRSFAIATILMAFLMTGLGLISFVIIKFGRPETFATAAIVTVIILGVFNIFVFIGVKESEEMKEMFLKGFEKGEKKGFIGTVKTALKTKNFRVSLVGYTVSITAVSLWGASGAFMLRYVLKVPFVLGILPTLSGVAGFLLLIPFWSNYARKHGFKKCYWTCFILHGLSFIPFLFITDIITYTIFAFIMGCCYSGEVIMLMPVASDTYDLVSSKIGKRVDATLIGVRTFFFRLAFVVQALVIGGIQIFTMFDPAVEVQSPLAIWGILIHAALIPAIMYLVMGLIFRKYYTLEGPEKEALVSKLKELDIYR